MLYINIIIYIYIIYIYLCTYSPEPMSWQSAPTQGWCTSRMNASGSLGGSQTIAVATKRWLIKHGQVLGSWLNPKHWASSSSGRGPALKHVIEHNLWSLNHLIKRQKHNYCRNRRTVESYAPATVWRSASNLDAEMDGNILPSQWLTKKMHNFCVHNCTDPPSCHAADAAGAKEEE
jgi:hypothetical protein